MIVSKHFHSDLEVYLFASTDDRPHTVDLETSNLVSSHFALSSPLRSVVPGAWWSVWSPERGAPMAGVDHAVYTKCIL